MPLAERVAALMREVAAEVVMPRHRALAAGDVQEKSPGEIVTVADREAELRLRDGLEALDLGIRIVGEEAAAEDPALLDDVGQGLLWLVDPLDGTANFASGNGPFGMMVALVEDGVPLLGLILDPRDGRLCLAERNRGATLDGEKLRARPSGRRPPVAALGTHFLSAGERAKVHAHAQTHLKVVPVPRCAAASYPRLVTGEEDIALFQRNLPWDHAPGALFLTEAGGMVTDWSGEPYRVGRGFGILAASDPGTWADAAGLLLAPEAGLPMGDGWKNPW
ncbi:inositol monophosphatase [Sandaracinobacter sp. RS1-74]|uniref:inositol monophosphatase family protein n=1 Tax=Sandaracinobacteroides sayramensis TaxID=2913411 RepID=UPI001EDB8F82|nr:inositol monophosphatase family protein [Sandaracinobacteroides sayramensis]MCG2840510.1 inositol monophosphatase [Sandaracinobacteroides sayramensis]